MLKKILLGLVAALALLVVFIATRPSTLRIERNIDIKAPAEVIFAQINDFRNWKLWSPWEKRDPRQKITYGGPPVGVGATYQWVGNDDVGQGRMTITANKQSERIEIEHEYIEPFPMKPMVDFVLTPGQDAVTVTWGMNLERGFVEKAIGVVADLDKLMGDDFNQGLAALKRVAEREAGHLRAEAAAKLAAEKAAAEAVAAPVTENPAP